MHVSRGSPNSHGVHTSTPNAPVGNRLGRTSEITATANVAVQKASALMKISATVSVIGIIGSIMVSIAGLLLLGDDTTFAFGILLVAAGVGGVLIWVFIGSLAQTLAAGVQVLAASARMSDRH